MPTQRKWQASQQLASTSILQTQECSSRHPTAPQQTIIGLGTQTNKKIMMRSIPFLVALVVSTFPLLGLLPSSTAFAASKLQPLRHPLTQSQKSSRSLTELFERISEKRRKQLGIGEGEDEYDLGKALETNTDPLISKIIAGSFILVMIALLVVGVIIPYTTDYGEGVCNPIANGGRC